MSECEHMIMIMILNNHSIIMLPCSVFSNVFLFRTRSECEPAWLSRRRGRAARRVLASATTTR